MISIRSLSYFVRAFVAIGIGLMANSVALAENSERSEVRDSFSIGERHVVRSEILDEDRSFWIYKPQSYESSKHYRDYPVLYVLDGNLFFHPFTGVVAQLSTDVTPLIPEMIVVGIDSQNRLRDSTPTHSLTGPGGNDSEAWGQSGGADEFQRFLESELVPHIEAQYSVSDYRVLAGYSLTGLPVFHNLFTRPNIFDAHIVLDGSLWWDDFAVLDEVREAVSSIDFAHNQLAIVTSQHRYPEPYITVEAGGREAVALLESEAPNGLNVIHIELTEETHHNLATIGLYRSLARIFDGHMMTLDELYLHPERIRPRFKALSDRLGTMIAPPEGVLNFFGYSFLRNLPDQEIDKAITYFKMNTEYHPHSANAWASLGEAYQEAQMNEQGVSAFEQALSLDPDNRKATRGLSIQ